MGFSKWSLFSCAALLGLLAISAAGQSTTGDKAVHISHDAVISSTQAYDPAHPTLEMPAPSEDEAGVTVSDFSCTAAVSGSVLHQFEHAGQMSVTVRVDSVDIHLQLKIKEWVSQGAGPKIWLHEGGHRIIAEHFYANADATAASIGREMIGREFRGTGADATTAANQALTVAASEIAGKYMTEVHDPCEQVQAIYDRITAHGTNGIEEVDAITQSLTEARKSMAGMRIAANQPADAAVDK